MPSAARDPATTIGGTAFENRYGRARCRSSSMSGPRPET